MKKLLIVMVLTAISALAFAVYTPSYPKQGDSELDGFYGIEDYNDPLYGDAYEKKTAGQITRTSVDR